MHITQNLLESIRYEFEAELKKYSDGKYILEIMSLHDRATALALGKRFLNDKTAMKATRNYTQEDAEAAARYYDRTGGMPDPRNLNKNQ